MIALARSSDPPESEGDADPSRWGDVRLWSLLAATADRYPSRLAFADQPNRENWSARPQIAWTYANTQRITERLATALAGLELAPGAPVGICLPNGSEACVAVLAVERAGYLPCLLPAGWSEDVLAQALEAASIVAIICQTRVAEEQPAEAFCRLAARYFGIRFVCAFGPQVPDGVIDLDRAILDTTPALTETNTGFLPGVVTFQLRDGRVIPLFRPTSSSLAAAVSVSRSPENRCFGSDPQPSGAGRPSRHHDRSRGLPDHRGHSREPRSRRWVVVRGGVPGQNADPSRRARLDGTCPRGGRIAGEHRFGRPRARGSGAVQGTRRSQTTRHGVLGFGEMRPCQPRT